MCVESLFEDMYPKSQISIAVNVLEDDGSGSIDIQSLLNHIETHGF